MGLDCIFNVMGPADNTFHGFFITNFIFIAFLILCIVPLHVQLVTTCDKLCKLYFSKHFNVIFKNIFCVLQTVIGLYRVARQCHQFYVPERKLKTNKQGTSQRLTQSMPPTDECIPGLQTRLILVLTEPSPLLAPSTPQTLALHEDRAMDKSAPEPVPESLTPTEDRSSDNEAPSGKYNHCWAPHIGKIYS